MGAGGASRPTEAGRTPSGQRVQGVQQALKVLGAVVFQLDTALLAPVRNLHLPAQAAGELLLRLAQVEGQLVPLLPGPGLFLPLEGLDQGLGLPDRELLGHHLLCRLDLELGGGEGQQGPGVAGGEGPCLHQGHHLLGQGQQAQGVGDGGAGFAHALGHLLLGQAVLLHQHPVAPGLLGGVQVLPLEVLNQGQLHHLAVVGLDDDGGHLVQAGQLGGAPAPLPGNNLIVAAGQAAHRQRLENAVEADGLGQVLQGSGVKALPGLVQAGLHLGDGQGHPAALLGLDARVAQQGVQAPSQAQFGFSFWHNTPQFTAEAWAASSSAAKAA